MDGDEARWIVDTITQLRAENAQLRQRIAELEDPHYLKAREAEIERLRTALSKISGAAEYDPADYTAASNYKPSEGIWTVDEYLADAALEQSAQKPERPPNHKLLH